MTKAVESPLLDDGAGQGSPSGRPLLPSDPWGSNWVPPTDSIVATRHTKAQKCLDRHVIPSQGARTEQADRKDGSDIGLTLDSETIDAAAQTNESPSELHSVSPVPVTLHTASATARDDSAWATAESEATGLFDTLPPVSPLAASDDLTPLADEQALDDALTIHRLLTEMLEAPLDGSDLLPAPLPGRGSRTTTSGTSALALADLADAVLDPLDPPPPEAPTPPPPDLAPPPDLTDRINANTKQKSRQRRQGRVGSGIVTSLVVTATAYWYYALGTLFLAVAVPIVAGWDATTVMSGSMEPVISAGDVVSFEQYDGEPLGVGTIVRFEDTVRPGGTITHRIVGVNPDGSYRTMGDANADPDSTPVPAESVVGVATLVSPHAGLPQYWWATNQYGWLAAWVAATGIAATVITVSNRVEGDKRRRWLRPAIAAGIVASLAGVGTAAWSSAAFAAGTTNADNDFAATGSFSDFTHLGSIGTATCSTTTSTTLTVGSAVPVGSTIIVRYAMRNRQQNATLGASDSQGNSYSVDASAVNGSRTATAILSGYVTTALAATDQITVTHPKGRAVVVSFDEYAGVTSGSRVSASGTNTGNSALPSVTVTPAQNDTLVIGSVSTRVSNTSFTQPTEWAALGTGRIICNRRMIYGGGWRERGIAADATYNPVLGQAAYWAEAVVAYRSS
jgi:signal peptidase I